MTYAIELFIYFIIMAITILFNQITLLFFALLFF